MTNKEWYEAQEEVFKLVEPMSWQGVQDMILTLEDVMRDKRKKPNPKHEAPERMDL